MDTSTPQTLYQQLELNAAKYGERAAYAVPPMRGRKYHPEGKQYSGRETHAAVQERIRYYRAAGYGPGHRKRLNLLWGLKC
jgi:hypothetical protein